MVSPLQAVDLRAGRLRGFLGGSPELGEEHQQASGKAGEKAAGGCDLKSRVLEVSFHVLGGVCDRCVVCAMLAD